MSSRGLDNSPVLTRRTTTSRRPPPAALGLAAALVIGAMACATARFEPSVPMRARSRDVTVTLEALRTGLLSREIVFESESTAPVSVREGWLTVATRAPCTGGADAAEIVIDDGRSPAGVLPAGKHEIAVRFHQSVNDFTLDTVVDLSLDGGRCVRAPAVSQSIPLVGRSRFVLSGTSALDFNSDVSGLRGFFGARIGGGAWLGSLLLTGEVGVGGALCNESLCGHSADGSLRSGFTVPLEVAAHYNLGSAIRGNMINFGLVGARYAFAPARLPAPGGDRQFAAHSVQAVLAWGIGDAIRGPFRHAERAPLFELMLPIGVLIAPGAPGGHVGFASGLTIRFLIPL
jgi:hypothetical protein